MLTSEKACYSDTYFFFFLFSAASMVISGVCVFFIALLKDKTQSLIMSCFFSGVSVIGWNALDVIGMELYPTHLR